MRRPARHRLRRDLLVAAEVVVALSALGGGIFGVMGARGVPRAWLDGTPFHTYLIPGLILAGVVGGSMIAALVAELRGSPKADLLSVAAGVVLLAWLLVEVIVIPFSWLQPAFAALGLFVIVLAVHHDSNGPHRAAGSRFGNSA